MKEPPRQKKKKKRSPIEWIRMLSASPECFRMIGDLLRIIQIWDELQ